MININLLHGSSSLLFIFSAIKALFASNLIYWKISNLFIIIASFLCNATNYHNTFLLIDYLTICSICLSYINNMHINGSLILFLLYEYFFSYSIMHIKNITFIIAVLKAIYNTYFYLNTSYFYILVIASIICILTYYLRNIFNHNKLLLTYLFHISIVIVLYVASMTAIYQIS